MNGPEELQHIISILRETARCTEASAKALAVQVEEARLLAAEDRVQISRLIVLVRRLIAQGEITLHGTQRLESTAAHVAQDLAASIIRADAAPLTMPGAGADAALRSPGQTAAEVAAEEAQP